MKHWEGGGNEANMHTYLHLIYYLWDTHNKCTYTIKESMHRHVLRANCIVQSCMAISEPWERINGQLQSLHNFQQKFGSNCSFCLKYHFEALHLTTSRLESFGHKSTPFHRPWTEAYTIQNSSKHENGQGLEWQMVNFLEYFGQRTLGCHSLSSLPFQHFSSPTNIHTHFS